MVWHRSKGVRLRGQSKWSRWLKNNNRRKRARVVQALEVERLSIEEGNGYSATIVAETISCKIARNGRKSKKNSVPPQETRSPAPFGHMDGPPG